MKFRCLIILQLQKNENADFADFKEKNVKQCYVKQCSLLKISPGNAINMTPCGPSSRQLLNPTQLAAVTGAPLPQAGSVDNRP